MHATSPSSDGALALEMAELVELEARWENLRVAPRTAAVRATSKDLDRMQRAYESFHAKLVAFNQRYPPGHVPERLLNNPLRLGLWCRQMKDLYLRVEHDPRVAYPVHLLEKAYRCADRIAARMNQAALPRSAPQGDRPAAVRALETLERWCDDLTGLEVGTGQPQTEGAVPPKPRGPDVPAA